MSAIPAGRALPTRRAREIPLLVGLLVLAGILGLAAPSHLRIAELLVAALVGAVLVARPRVGVAALWVTGLIYGILLNLVHGNTTLLLWKDALAAALLLRTLFSAEARARIRNVPWIPLAAWVAFALIMFALVAPTYTGLMGLRITFEWVTILYTSAAWIDAKWVRRALMWLLPVVALTVGLAAWQARLGTGSLLSRGYEYGTTLREAGGFVRAFGASTYGAPFGYTMAVLMLGYLALALWSSRRSERMLGALGGLLTVSGVALSLSRTAMFAGIAGVLVMLWMASRASTLPVRRRSGLAVFLVVGLAVGVLAFRGGGFVVQGLTGHASSFHARLTVWSKFLHIQDPVIGQGPGSAGVAPIIVAVHQGIPAKYITSYTDNYYVASVTQYGVIGLVLLLLFLVAVARKLWQALRAANHPPWLALAGLGAFTYLVVAMLAVNSWEDFPAPILIWTLVGAALAAREPAGHST